MSGKFDIYLNGDSFRLDLLLYSLLISLKARQFQEMLQYTHEMAAPLMNNFMLWVLEPRIFLT